MKVKLITIDGGKHASNLTQVSNPIFIMKDPTNNMVEYEVEVRDIRIDADRQIIVLGLKDN